MSASLAISSAALANSAAASARAREAEEVACKKYVVGYEHDTATVQESRQYAECINLIRPDEMTGGEVLAVKLLILIGLVGAVAGFVAAKRQWGATTLEYVFYPVCGFFVLPCSAAVIGGIFYAAYWMVTA